MTKPLLVGIYGGTFDPIHYGHLRVAEELTDTIGFDQFFFVPAGQPRLREVPIASSSHRVEMVKLAIRSHPHFFLDQREINRSKETATVESLREYHAEYGDTAALCFIMGADAFAKIHHWYCWQELFQLCHLIIVERPGNIQMKHRYELPLEIQQACTARWTTDPGDLTRQFSGMVCMVQTTLLDISATQIRCFIAAGKSVRYLLPDPILGYINTHHLYVGENGFG